MSPPDPLRCPECGKAVPADSQHRICPACLMEQALASRTVVDGSGEITSTPPPSPEEIAGRFPQFEILQCLGRGGMGVVYKARQKSLDRLVAIKILPPERVGEEKFAERFAREAQTLAKLNHSNIVTVFDYGETDGLFYIIMEYVDGVNLRDLLRDGKLEPGQALAIVPPICEALQYAHDKGIVHRDIKPENLLLDRDGRIKIADFGIAALIGANGENIGTPPYMAPEQSGTSRDVDLRVDIYALGVVLYEMLTGERPAKDVVAPSKKVRIDVRLDEMVLRALEKNPEMRYQTAGEFRTVVETANHPAALESPATPDSSVTDARRKKRRKKVILRMADGTPGRAALLGITTVCLASGVLMLFAGSVFSRYSGELREAVPAMENLAELPAYGVDAGSTMLFIIGSGILFLAVALVVSLALVIRGAGSGAGKGLAAGCLMLLLGGSILALASVGAVMLFSPSGPKRILDPLEPGIFPDSAGFHR